MPMDGLTLGFATREMNAILPGGRIDRITQPEKDTIVLLVRAGAANHRLLLCASPNNARCHFTNLNFPNPLEPPMFCMLLRKQILSGRILSIQQMHGDRVIHVDIDTVNELGDHVLRRLVLEIMGRHSNLMLLDEDGRILEAARHVSADMSRVRQIQPGLPYLPPPAQDKIAPEDADAENLLAKLEAQGMCRCKGACRQRVGAVEPGGEGTCLSCAARRVRPRGQSARNGGASCGAAAPPAADG